MTLCMLMKGTRLVTTGVRAVRVIASNWLLVTIGDAVLFPPRPLTYQGRFDELGTYHCDLFCKWMMGSCSRHSTVMRI